MTRSCTPIAPVPGPAPVLTLMAAVARSSLIAALLAATTLHAVSRRKHRPEALPSRDSTVEQQDVPAAAPARPVAPTLAVPQWLGTRFVVLPMSPPFRQFGYEMYPTAALDKESTPLDPSRQLRNRRYRYEALARHALKVTSVRPSGPEFLIAFEDTVLGAPVYARTIQQAIKAIAPHGDLEVARARWEGTVVYARKRQMNTFDTATGRMGSIKVAISTPLSVAKVVRGTMPLPPQPLWLVVEGPDSLRGFLPVHISWTNVLGDMVRETDPWAEFVVEQDPLKTYRWEPEVWANINEHRLVTGMTFDQARLCWGDPLSVDTSDAAVRWTYKGQVLVFANGVLQQNIPR